MGCRSVRFAKVTSDSYLRDVYLCVYNFPFFFSLLFSSPHPLSFPISQHLFLFISPPPLLSSTFSSFFSLLFFPSPFLRVFPSSYHIFSLFILPSLLFPSLTPSSYFFPSLPFLPPMPLLFSPSHPLSFLIPFPLSSLPPILFPLSSSLPSLSLRTVTCTW